MEYYIQYLIDTIMQFNHKKYQRCDLSSCGWMLLCGEH